MTSTVNQAGSPIQSVERAAAILRLLSVPRRRLGVAELGRELGLSKGTVHGILRTLAPKGLLEQDKDSRKHQLGAAALPMSFAYLASNPLRSAALHSAYALAICSGESVRVGTLYDKQVLIIDHVLMPGDGHQALDIGSLIPTHATALGKALLSHHRSLLSELGAEGLQRFTPATVTDAARLQREIDDVSQRGWATETGELSPGVAAIAAPIAAGGGAQPGAIAIEGSPERLLKRGSPPAELASAVMESARVISRRLGATPWSGDRSP